jgi:uncharacterized protein YukE
MHSEWVHLKVQEWRIPVVQEPARSLQDERSALVSQLEDLNSDIEAIEADYNSQLSQNHRGALEFTKQIGLEGQAVTEFEEKAEEIRSAATATIADLKQKSEVERVEAAAAEAEAAKLEAETAALVAEALPAEFASRREIEIIRKMIEEVRTQASNRKRLAVFEIPEYPYDQ